MCFVWKNIYVSLRLPVTWNKPFIVLCQCSVSRIMPWIGIQTKRSSFKPKSEFCPLCCVNVVLPV